MGVKYTIPFKANDNVSWRVNISLNSWSSAPIFVQGVGQTACTHSWDVETTDDPFSVLVPSSIALSVNDEGQIDVNELQQAQDRDFTVQLFREGLQKWSGYLVPDGIQKPLKSYPYGGLQLKAICGLSVLATLPYVHNDLPGVADIDTGNTRCIMNYIRNILFTNLGIQIPIRWTNELRCTAFPDTDVFTGGVRWSVKNEGFISYQSSSSGNDAGPQQTCEYILKGFLASMQSRIYQDDGIWKIRRVNEFVQGSVFYKQIAATLGFMTVMSGTESVVKHIGRSGYRFVSEDSVLTVKQGFKSCKVTYTANIRENILPNGSQDTVKDLLFDNTPIYWEGPPGQIPVIASVHPSLDGRDGFATELQGALDGNYFSMGVSALYTNGLPIDTKVQIKRLNFGFIFSPIIFPTTGTPDQIVDWTTKPMQLNVVLNLFGTRYWLNDYGFWQTTMATITIVVDNLRLLDVVQINFDHFQGIIMPEPTDAPVSGDESDLQIVFIVQNGTKYQVDKISVTIENGNDVYESSLPGSMNTTVDERELQISSSFSGYMLSNIMSSPFESDAECAFRDALIYEGSLTGLTANAIMRFRYKSSRVFNGSVFTSGRDYSFDELYTIDSLGASKFLPMNASYNIEKCITSLVAMESRSDSISLTEKYYSSNDNQLSN